MGDRRSGWGHPRARHRRSAGAGIYVALEQDRDKWNQLSPRAHCRLAHTDVADPAAIIADMDPEQPVYAISTLEDAFAGTTLQHRSTTILLVMFAGLAVTLAALGVYR